MRHGRPNDTFASRGQAPTIPNRLVRLYIDPLVRDVERLLADSRVNPAARDGEALILAVTYNVSAVVDRFLADDRVDPSRGNNRVIHTAVQYGRARLVERLLAHPRVDPTLRARLPPRTTFLRPRPLVRRRARVPPALDEIGR